MSVFRKKARLSNPEKPETILDLEMVVDSGATYTQIPSSVLHQLGVRKQFKRKLKIATGEIIERDAGILQIQLNGETGPTWVIFGDEGSDPLLGAVTLEEFGLAVDPVNKILIPVPELMLAAGKTVIPIGPYHPLQEEPEFFRLHVEGERVVGLDIELGYNHRGIEKLAESKTYDQIIFLVERICGICSTSHPIASVQAVEDVGGVEVPERALYISSIIGELERLHSHLLWVGLAGHFLGYNTVWMWAWRYREPVLDIFEQVTGNRQHYAMMKVGGVRRDIEDSDIPAIEKAVDALVPIADMFKGAIVDDPVIHARTKGVGILTKEDIQNYGALSPTARASGVAIGVRRDHPHAAYGLVDWNVITQEEGDVFAKAVVRVLEMYESVKIIKQCLGKLKKVKGEIDAKVKEIPPGEGIGHYEAPRGEVFHYVRSDGTNRPVRYKVRAPSYMNVPTNKTSVVGETVSDATIILAAVDPCYCCTERTAAIDTNTEKRTLTGQDLIKLSQEKTKRIADELGLEMESRLQGILK